MKVLDLQCTLGHIFEGWFGSEADYLDQQHRSLVQCPMCGDSTVSKRLSAPCLALSKSSGSVQQDRIGTEPAALSAIDRASAEWLAVVRQLVSQTTDVGSNFAEEVRKIHYGESEARGIRGTATQVEAHALADEGIEVMSIALPIASKERLQ